MHFFTDAEELEQHKGTIFHLLSPVSQNACKGEFTMDDLWDLALDKQVFIGLMDEPEMAGAFEFRHYPQFVAVNILALGGRGLDRFMMEALPKFRKWAAMAGAQRIEASCSEAMARMLMRGGFQKDYVQISIPVGEQC